MHSDISDIIDALVRFRDERDWKQFHNAKDLALALSIEAAELNEAFLWKAAGEADGGKIREELADVLAFAFLLAHERGLDVKEIVMEKLRTNSEKYAVEKSKGSARKYTDL
jgi:NTP pyrophosphatase (non-canonical NTP hydrolase)